MRMDVCGAVSWSVMDVSNRLVTVDNVSAGQCGASPAWPNGLPADRTRDDRRSG